MSTMIVENTPVGIIRTDDCREYIAVEAQDDAALEIIVEHTKHDAMFVVTNEEALALGNALIRVANMRW